MLIICFPANHIFQSNVHFIFFTLRINTSKHKVGVHEYLSSFFILSLLPSISCLKRKGKGEGGEREERKDEERREKKSEQNTEEKIIDHQRYSNMSTSVFVALIFFISFI